MDANTKLIEIEESQLRKTISEKFDMTVTLRNARLGEHELKTHKKFIFEYVLKHCSGMSIYDFDVFFMQYNSGDIVNDPYASAQSIIGAIKVFKNKDVVRGTKNSNIFEYTRSDKNLRRVNNSLESGVVDKGAYYSLEEYKKIDKEFCRKWNETMNNVKRKFK